MRRYVHLFIILICCFPWALSGPVHGGIIVPEVVHGQLVLGRDTHTYVLNSITIATDGELKVLSGVKLLFNPGAALHIEGKLTLAGTAKSPITLMEAVEGAGWNGISSNCASLSEEVGYSVISSAQQGVQLCASTMTVHDLTIRDSPNTSLTIGETGFVYSKPLVVGVLHFLTPLIGKNVADLGLHLIGAFLDITIDQVYFPHFTAIPSVLVHSLFTITGTHQNVLTGVMTAGSKCYISQTKSDPGVLVYGFTAASCPQKVVPVVFVPGYGTSINMSFLTQSYHQNPDITGWHFASLLTPQYDQLLTRLSAQNIPYKVAYYDWRQPLAVISSQYLKPVIDQAKQEFQADTVNIVAHSFGGLVARQYIQGTTYEGDVDSLFQIATPNEGALKAYPVWEDGDLPSDWQVLLALLRLYQLQHITERLSLTTTVQRFFPSVQSLLPTYNALTRQNSIVPEDTLSERNVDVNALNVAIEKLTSRVRVITVASTSEQTDRLQEVTSAKSRAPWKDGEPVGSSQTGSGDGTVLTESVEGIPGEHYEVAGDHLEAVANAIPALFSSLYPNYSGELQNSALPFAPGHPVWFFFDCPVAVTITSPGGTTYSSEVPQASSDTDIERTDDLIMMGIPYAIGDYVIHIQATADTEVRWWEEEGVINQLTLAKDESTDVVYTISPPVVIAKSEDPLTPTTDPSPIPLPSPQSSPVPISTPTPLPEIPPIAEVVIPFQSLQWAQFTFQAVPVVAPMPTPKPLPKQQIEESRALAPLYMPWRKRLIIAVLMCAVGVFLPP